MNDGLNIDEIEARFFVLGRMEILNILNDLILRDEPVTVHFDDGAGNSVSFVTSLLEARDKSLIFDMSGDAQANLRLQACGTCSFTACPDGIRVQFTGSQMQEVSWGDSSAFCMPLPERLARLQRQESLRILISGKDTPAITLFTDDGTNLGEWPLHDLSVGGLGITVDSLSRPALEQKLARVSFLLPGHGNIDCPVRLRHATGLANNKATSHPCRIGMSFTSLLPEARVAIQRYIIETEHGRRSSDEYEAEQE